MFRKTRLALHDIFAALETAHEKGAMETMRDKVRKTWKFVFEILDGVEGRGVDAEAPLLGALRGIFAMLPEAGALATAF